MTPVTFKAPFKVPDKVQEVITPAVWLHSRVNDGTAEVEGMDFQHIGPLVLHARRPAFLTP